MRYCPGCGAELVEDAQGFCHQCGKDLDVLGEPEMEPLHAKAREAEEASPEPPQDDDVPEADIQPLAASAPSGEREPIVYELDHLSGHDFEDVMATIFERHGYRVERTPATADEGRDLILHTDSDTIIVECKHRKGSIGRPVVQKLQGATISYDGATQGLVVTTGSFANTAFDYVQQSNRQTRVQLDLWDHSTLVERAAEVDVYLTTSQEGTDIVFATPWRTPDQARNEVWATYLQSLNSNPRPIKEAIDLDPVNQDHIPAILVDYSVSKSFETSTYHLYDARDSGRVVIPLDPDVVTDQEKRFWSNATFKAAAPATIEEEPVEAFFGVDMAPYREQVAKEVAFRLSKTVHYTGRNNQSYSKFCEVQPSDVDLDSKQVLLCRDELRLLAGPKEYTIWVTGDASRRPEVTHDAGFSDGDQGLLSGQGYLCNDCGLIAPSEGDNAGMTCAACSRTLCQAHNWRWPRKTPFPWQPYCSDCYEEQDTSKQHLEDPPSILSDYLKTSAAALVPGLPFFWGKRVLTSLLFLVLLLFVAGGVSVAYEEADAAMAMVPYVFAAGLSVLGSLAWSRRVQAHRRNADELEGYAPEWEEAGAADVAEEIPTENSGDPG